jgi:hypothetical protein
MTARSGVLGLLLLAACAAHGGWVKPGGDSAGAARDYDECVGLAEQATSTDARIDQDIIASRSSDIARAESVRTGARLMQESTRNRGRAVIDACMTAKGYSKRR